MDHSIRTVNGIVIIDLVGSIRSQRDYLKFRDIVNSSMRINIPPKIAVNCENLKFANSSVLGRLVILADETEKKNGRLTIYNLNDDMVELFAVTRLNSKLEICKDENEVLQKFISNIA